MKLLFCKSCQDVFKLVLGELRYCRCARTHGHYVDEVNAVYYGEYAVPLGFQNSSFVDAVIKQPAQEGPGRRFEAFVIPTECETFWRG